MAKKTTTQEWLALLNAEVRRQRADERKQSSVPTVYVPRVRAVPCGPQNLPNVIGMSLPPCLCRADTEAGKSRRDVVLRREYWQGQIDHVGARRPAVRHYPMFG
jgi:hypothetical protein